jgi:hypothetical protein
VNGTVGATTPSTGAFTTLSATGNVTLGDASTDTLNVGNGGLIKDASGNVGIGTSSPLGKLQVKGANPQIFMEDSAGGTNGKFTAIGTSNGNMTFNRYLDNGTLFGQFMTIDSSGNLGIGNTSPGGLLQVGVPNTSTGSLRAYSGFVNIDAGYQSSNVSGTAAAPSLIWAGDDNTGIWHPASDTLAISTAGTERARFDSSGNLLVKKTSSGIGSIGVENLANGAVFSTLAGSTSATSSYNLYSTGAAAYRFYVGMDGTINATSIVITAISDQRLKENVRDIDTGLNEIMSLKPRRFDWKEGKGQDKKNAAGFIAQEFEDVFPECVGTSKAGADGIEYKNINHETLIPTLVKAIQELKAEFDAYKASHP